MAVQSTDNSAPLPPPPLTPGLYPAGFNPYAAPPQPAPTGILGGINDLAQSAISPFQTSVQNRLSDIQSFLTQDPSKAQFGTPADTNAALGMFSWTKAGSGGLADVHLPGQAVAGAKAAGGAALDELAAQAAKVPPLEGSGLRGFAGGEGGAGKIPGSGAFTVKELAPDAHQVVTPSGADGPIFAKANGFKGDTLAAANAKAAELNAPTAAQKAGGAEIPPVVVPKPAKPNAITQLTDEQLMTLKEVPDVPAATVKAVDAEIAARAVAKFQTPETLLISATRNIPREVTNAIAGGMRSHPDGGAISPKHVIAAMGQDIENAIAATPGAKSNVATRTAIANSIIADAKAKNLIIAAKADAKTAVLATRTEQIAEAAKAGESPLQTVNATVDALAEHATQPGLFDSGIQGGGDVGRTNLGGPKPPFNPWHLIPDLANAVRSIVAGADFSAAGRQAFPLLFSHPLSYAKSIGKGVQAMFQTTESLNRTTQGFREAIAKTGINAGTDGLYLSELGGGLVKGEERYQGLQNLVGRIPIVGGFYNATERAYVGTLNAVRTYSYLGSVNMYDSIGAKLGKEGMSLPDKQAIATDINRITGQGFKLDPANTPEVVLAVAKLSNGLGFAPKFTVARARLIPDTIKSFMNMGWDAGHGHVPNPADVEQVRLAAGYAAGVAAIWQVASAQGLKIEFDPHNTNFGKVDLGKEGSAGITQATALMETLGFSTQNYGGHVYLDPGQGIGQDIKLLVQLVTNQAVGSNGKAYRPWDAKFGQNSAFDLVANFFENKAAPLPSTVIQISKKTTGDTGDVTQNPITGLLMPMVASSVLGVSGATRVGGPLHADWVPGALDAGGAEKQRIGRDIPTAPGVDTLSPDKQLAYTDAVKKATDEATNSVINLPAYQQATDVAKQDLITKATSAARGIAQKTYGLNVALTGNPSETVAGTAIALAGAGTNIEKGAVLLQIKDAGRLTPDVAQAIDDQRKHTDPKASGYQLTVSEYIKVHQLASSWAQAPAFNTGSQGEWASAERARTQYMKIQKEFPPTKDGSVTIPNPKVQDFYFAAANGLLSLFYTQSGARKTALVSEERKALEQDPLWTHVGKTPDTVAP